MKYCPYCGASVVDDAVSFCAECGKKLTPSEPQPQEEKKEKPVKNAKKLVREKSERKMKPKKKAKVPKQEAPAVPEEPKPDDGYDGYYDDIVPTDTGRLREGIDWKLMKKIGLVIAGVLVVTGLCIAAMYLL